MKQTVTANQQGLKQKWMEAYDFSIGEDFEEEESAKKKLIPELENAVSFAEGEVFKGRVISLGKDYVIVDIGYKQEGLISIKEFTNFDGVVEVAVGDVIDVYLERLESNSGHLILSKDKAEILQAWDRISAACESGTPLEGTVISKVKGGLSVDIGVKAFLPGSQLDLRPTRNLDRYLGKRMEFKVIKFNKKRGNIVLSRRAILQDERTRMRSDILTQIQEEMIVKGIVKNITDYGVFIDLGGIDGLLHITDMSWGRVKHPGDLVQVGDELDVKILKFDKDKERVSLGLKQVLPNPWDDVETKFVIGQRVEGEIVSVKDYGIFAELENGIEGLVHVSEMSWTGKIKNPIKHFSVGEKIEAQVLEIDKENKRISLGIKQIQENPWTSLASKYPINRKVKGVVKSVVDFGIFIDLGEEIDALIHVSDISWSRKNVNPSKEFKEGDSIEAMVLIVDPENMKFCLGIKQLEEDPWKKIEERLPVGSLVEAQVVRIADFGVFVELETGIEGLIHISELSEDRVERPEDACKKGDTVKAMVISLDKDAKKIALSIRSALESDHREVITATKQDYSPGTLADKLKDIKI